MFLFQNIPVDIRVLSESGCTCSGSSSISGSSFCKGREILTVEHRHIYKRRDSDFLQDLSSTIAAAFLGGKVLLFLMTDIIKTHWYHLCKTNAHGRIYAHGATPDECRSLQMIKETVCDIFARATLRSVPWKLKWLQGPFILTEQWENNKQCRSSVFWNVETYWFSPEATYCVIPIISPSWSLLFLKLQWVFRK